jgi:hypothetical protein
MGEITQYPSVGHPGYQPTNEQRTIVENAAAFGEPHHRIASFLGIDQKLGHPHISHTMQQTSSVTNNHASTSTDTRIGEIHIHTHATDAAGIARDIKPALERTGIAMQANYSLA